MIIVLGKNAEIWVPPSPWTFAQIEVDNNIVRIPFELILRMAKILDQLPKHQKGRRAKMYSPEDKGK